MLFKNEPYKLLANYKKNIYTRYAVAYKVTGAVPKLLSLSFCLDFCALGFP
jgi:hypothetical protein